MQYMEYMQNMQYMQYMHFSLTMFTAMLVEMATNLVLLI